MAQQGPKNVESAGLSGVAEQKGRHKSSAANEISHDLVMTLVDGSVEGDGKDFHDGGVQFLDVSLCSSMVEFEESADWDLMVMWFGEVHGQGRSS